MMDFIYHPGDIEKYVEKHEETLLLRPDGSPAAVAVPTTALLEILEKYPNKSFRADLQPRTDGSFYAVLYLIEDDAEPRPINLEGTEVRFYTRNDTPVIVYTPQQGTVHESKTEYVDNATPSQRYWATPFIGNGTYKP